LANGGVVASPDGKLIAMTTGDFQNHEMSIIDVETKKPTKRWKVPTVVQALAWSADGSTLAGIMLGDSTRKSQILVWDTKTWEQRAAFDHPGYPGALAMSADGKIIATGASTTDANVLKVWDVAAQKEILSKDHKAIIVRLGLSADGKTVVCNGLGAKFDSVVAIDVAKGKEKASFRGADFVISADASIAVE